MKNKKSFWVILAVTLVLGMVFASCKDSGGGGGATGGADSALDGTWKRTYDSWGDYIGDSFKFNKGNFEYDGGENKSKGTYTTKDGKISFTCTTYSS